MPAVLADYDGVASGRDRRQMDDGMACATTFARDPQLIFGLHGLYEHHTILSLTRQVLYITYSSALGLSYSILIRFGGMYHTGKDGMSGTHNAVPTDYLACRRLHALNRVKSPILDGPIHSGIQYLEIKEEK